MVRREVVAAKAGRSRAWLNDAAELLLNPPDAFLADSKGRDYALLDYALLDYARASGGPGGHPRPPPFPAGHHRSRRHLTRTGQSLHTIVTVEVARGR
jgi:hypothetical protein